MSVKFDNITWNIIEKFFNDNPQVLVKHHLPRLVKEKETSNARQY